MPETSRKNFLVPAAIVAAGVIVAFAVIYASGGFSNRGSQLAAAPGGAAGGGDAVTAGLADDSPFLGNPSAPVTVVEFADFQCPFCARFFQTTQPRLVEKFIKTGKMRLVYRGFAFLGQESEWAAAAAACANEQGKFWQYHDHLYNHQQGENQGAFSKDHLKLFAKDLGLDASRFDVCLDSDKFLKQVEENTAAGREAGVTGAPTFFISGRAFDPAAISGLTPYVQAGAVRALDPKGSYKTVAVGALPPEAFELILNAALGENENAK